MRVNSPNSAAGAPVSQADVKSTKKSDDKKAAYDAAANAKKSVASDSSKAEISSRAKDLAKAKQVATDAPDVREGKIAELKEKIAAGKYKVDSASIADKLVDDHMGFPGA